MPSQSPRPRSLLSHLFRFIEPDDLRILIRHLVRAVRDIVVAGEPVPELTYNDTIAYFVNERPDDPRIVKGAVLLIPRRLAMQVYFLFLDEHNTPLGNEGANLYGRSLRVVRLDDELQEAFGDTELLIFE